jgi:hypothetical protein
MTDSEYLKDGYKKGGLMRNQAPFFNVERVLALS